MAVPSNDAKSTKPAVPSEVKIIAGIEAFSGLVYLVGFLALLSITFSPILIFLSFLSFAIAYGLWHIQKWAWLLSLILSIFGAGSGIFVLAFTGASESSLFGGVPMVILDLIVVVMLMSKDVRSAFRV